MHSGKTRFLPECLKLQILLHAGMLLLSLIHIYTLTADRSQELPEDVAVWLDTMRRAGVRLTIVSNGAEKRVRSGTGTQGPASGQRAAPAFPHRWTRW